MARVSISVPDDVVAGAKSSGLNISRLATSALTDELDRLDKIAALDDYLAEFEACRTHRMRHHHRCGLTGRILAGKVLCSRSVSPVVASEGHDT